MNDRRSMVVLVLLLMIIGTVPAAGDGRLEFVDEGFEGAFPPEDWAIITDGGINTWWQTDVVAHSGAFCTFVVYSSPGQVQDEWLVTPAMDTRGATSLQLEWWETSRYWGGNFGHHHYIKHKSLVSDLQILVRSAKRAPKRPTLDEKKSIRGRRFWMILP